MLFNDPNLLHAHNKYFSYIRQRDGYYKFSQLAKDILAHRSRTAPTVERYGFDALNHDHHPNTASAAIFALMAAETVIHDYPLYYLSGPIIEEFLQTDLSEVSKVIDDQFKSPLPMVFVAFPEATLTDNAGDYITHAFIQMIEDPSGGKGLKVSCNLRRPGLSAASMRIATDYGFAITEKGLSYGRLVGKADSEQALNSFANSPEGKFASIACQIMLTLCLGDEYVDDGTNQSSATQKKKNGRSSKGPKIPRMIRLPETKLPRMSASSNTEEGQARRPHWKRGHWRNQAYGPKHSLRRIQWIRPAWVGKKPEELSTVKA